MVGEAAKVCESEGSNRSNMDFRLFLLPDEGKVLGYNWGEKKREGKQQ